MLSRLIVLLAGLMTGAAAVAQGADGAADADGPWFGKVKFGYLATSGNTENTNLNTAFRVGYTAGTWTHSFDVFAINASENEVTTAE
ncbi:MAG: DUF481 domain-containing protein, partial [Woeseiaceae bacterium]